MSCTCCYQSIADPAGARLFGWTLRNGVIGSITACPECYRELRRQVEQMGWREQKSNPFAPKDWRSQSA
jgi:hypothetical protein